jgi:molybdate/tungstate transport system ATP-binding protein
MIKLEGISWQAPGGFAIQDVNLEIPTGIYAVLMGSTGGGKTTLLELLCGLRHPTAGRIWLNDRDVTHLEPRHRQIGYLPQDLALFPSYRVRDQIGFAVWKHRKWWKNSPPSLASVICWIVIQTTSLGVKNSVPH